jgi:hypothetical protein
MDDIKEEKLRWARINMKQYSTAFSLSYDVILKKLIDYLFDENIIDADSKWSFTKFCILRVLFDYADEVIKGYTYTPDQLVELIDTHTRFRNKFQDLLSVQSDFLQYKKEAVYDEFEE